MELKLKNLTGKQKVAVLLVSIGLEAASNIFKNFKENEIEELTLEIANLKAIPAEVIDGVVEEFYQMVQAQEYVTQGGLDYAQRLLQQVMGEPKADEITHRLQSALQIGGFDLLKTASPDQILHLVQNEHPQTICLVLSHLEPRQAAQTLAKLPDDLQQEVAYRLATMQKISSELIDEVGKTLQSQFETVEPRVVDEVGGARRVAEILNLAGKAAERNIMDGIERRDPILAQEIKNLLFVFDDLMLLDDRSVQRVLKEVDSKVLAVALKGSSAEIKEKIFRNMSERAGNMLREEMEYMGPVRVKEVDDAQRQIANLIRTLEEEGEVVIMGKEQGQEEFVA